MRHVICACCTLLCGFLPALSGADLTVVLDFESSRSPLSIAVMESEAARLLKQSGVSLDWRMLSSSHESFSRLALVKFKGRCEMNGISDDTAGPPSRLGLTYRADGRVIPFSEVECDEIRSTLATAHLPADPPARDILYGRALGRVLAHELIHVINGDGRHAKTGVAQKYLSAARLISDRID